MFNKKKLSVFRLVKWFVILAIVVVVAVPFIPISWVNPLLRIFPHSAQLIGAKGRVIQGSFQAIKVHGKKYPLNCDYEPEKLGLGGVTYHINCRDPLELKMTLSMTWSGHITIEKSRLSGELRQASDWLVLAGYPSSINGNVEIAIEYAQLVSRKLVALDMTGKLPALCLFSDASKLGDLGRDCLNDVIITTPQKVLTPVQPIRVVVNSKPNDASQFQFKATSDIDGERQQTRIVLGGEAAQKYATILRMVGREESLNNFVILLEGFLFQ